MATNINPVNTFLETEIAPRELEILLSQIEFEYTMLVLGVNIEVEAQKSGEALYYLRQFINRLKACGEG